MNEVDASTWVLAKAERGGRPLLISFRQFPAGLPTLTYPKRISIFWKLSDPDQNGLPSDQEFDRLAAFEDRLIETFERDEHSILTIVLSHGGENEYVFYTGDVAGFFERLTNLPQEKDRYPTATRQGDDPNWSYFHAAIPVNVRPLITSSEGADSTKKTGDPE